MVIASRLRSANSYLIQARRNNYYGTVLLYIVGQGIVPWEEGQDMGLNGVVGSVNQSLDSYPIPTNGWLGGLTTLPYQYSDEPSNHFKEFAETSHQQTDCRSCLDGGCITLTLAMARFRAG